MKIAANKVLAEEVHQFHVVLERLQSLASVVGETGGVFDDGVDPIQPHQEVAVLAEETVVLRHRGGVSHQRGLLEVEGGLEVLDGGDGQLVGGVHGDTLTEAGEDVLQLLVGLGGLWEGRVEQLPRPRHVQHLNQAQRERRESEVKE